MAIHLTVLLINLANSSLRQSSTPANKYPTSVRQAPVLRPSSCNASASKATTVAFPTCPYPGHPGPHPHFTSPHVEGDEYLGGACVKGNSNLLALCRYYVRLLTGCSMCSVHSFPDHKLKMLSSTRVYILQVVLTYSPYWSVPQTFPFY